MKEDKIVYAVRKTYIRKEEKEERMIFEKKEQGWVYHAPNAQDHTEEQVEDILKKLKELNNE